MLHVGISPRYEMGNAVSMEIEGPKNNAAPRTSRLTAPTQWLDSRSHSNVSAASERDKTDQDLSTNNASQSDSLSRPSTGLKNSSSTTTHNSDSRVVAARLNEFAEFLVQFNNNTVKAMEARSQKVEALLEERVQQIREEQREHERCTTEKLDSMFRNFQESIVEGTKRAFLAECQARDFGLTRTVSGAISSLGPRIDEVKRHINENETTLKSLDTCIKSVDARLTKFENRLPFASATSIDGQAPPAASAAPLPTTPNALATVCGQLEELGCMLDQLSKQMQGARDEAHQDKEDLARLFDDTHKNLAITLHSNARALKNAIGVGKGCLKSSKTEGSSSLAECLEVLSMDFHEAMENLRDAEASHNDSSFLKLKHTLEGLTSYVKANTHPGKVVREIGVMTDVNQEFTTKERAASTMTDGWVEGIIPQKFRDLTIQTDFSVSTSKRDDSCVLLTGDRKCARISADSLAGVPAAVPSPMSLQPWPWPHFAPPDGGYLSLDNIAHLKSLFGAQACLDPRTLLYSPPSSVSASRSASTTLKRKADAVDIQEGADDASRSESSSKLPAPAEPIDDGYSFDLGQPLSPLTPIDDETMPDLDRSSSPLAPLPSENEENSTGEHQDDSLTESGRKQESFSTLPSVRESLPSERHMPVSSSKAGSQEQENSGELGHIKSQRSTHDFDTPSVTPAKRRRIDIYHQANRPLSSTTSSGSRKRGRPRKSGGSVITHVHSQEVLEEADWPAKSMVNETFDHQLLQCDRCDSYYHYRCVGVKEGDERLTPEGSFICPPCVFINDPQVPVKNSNTSCCGRPDCDWPGEASDGDKDYFVVEKILGRSVADVEGPQRIYLWLIKWHGYGLKDCDWLLASALPNADELISKFYASAVLEGVKVPDDDSIYLLREARNKLNLAIKKKWKWA